MDDWRDQIHVMLEDLELGKKPFNDWESNFIFSFKDRIEDADWSPSEKQESKVEQIWGKYYE